MDQDKSATPSTPTRRKILIVDDQRIQVEGIKYALKSVDFDVTYTNDGNKGLAMIKASPPDLLILDLGMPGRSGFLILEQLRSEDIFSGPVVVVTGIDGQRHQDYAMTLGADAFFRKPYVIEDLVVKVQELLAP
jgi:DNA-binding response OmpR family regulator